MSPDRLPARIARLISPEPNTGCWLWIGAASGNGYGGVRHEGQRQGAHRVVYEMLVGPVPEGRELDHLCRVRCCVNPAHMEPVTRSENLMRGMGRNGRGRRTDICPHGHAFTAKNTRMYKGSRVCRTCQQTKDAHCYRHRRPSARPFNPRKNYNAV